MIEISRDSNVERAAKRELATRREFVRRAAGLVALGGMARPALADDLKTGLVSYWELNEESGTRYDAHGSNDLTDNNTVGYATGIVGNAADFEKDNSEYLEKTNGYSAGLSPGSGDYTFAAWLKPESQPAAWAMNSFASCGENWSFAYQQYDNYQLLLTRWVGSWNYHSAGVTLSNGTWYFVAVVWDHDDHTAEFFVNASSIGADSSGSTASQSTADNQFRLGRDTYTYWDGLMDQAGFWSRKLTSDEITYLYNSGAGRSYGRRRVMVIQ